MELTKQKARREQHFNSEIELLTEISTKANSDLPLGQCPFCRWGRPHASNCVVLRIAAFIEELKSCT